MYSILNMDILRCDMCDYRDWVSENRKEIKVLGDYVNGKEKIKHQCLSCGAILYITPNSLKGSVKHGGNGCSKCSAKRVGERFRLSESEYLEKISSTHPHIELTGKFEGVMRKTDYFCKTHSEAFTTTPNNLRVRAGCRLCAKEVNSRKAAKAYIDDLAEFAPHIKMIDKYVDCRTPVRFVCSKHDFEWISKPVNVNARSNCPACGMDDYKCIYLMVDSNKHVKIGITKQKVTHNRALAAARAMGVKAVNIITFTCDNAYTLEQELLSTHRKMPYGKSDGRYWREFRCMTESEFNSAVSFLNERASFDKQITYQNS